MIRAGSILVAGPLAGLLAMAPATVHAEAPTQGDNSDSVGPARRDSGRALLISGVAVAGTGLLFGATGFGVVGGMHAANPGSGLSIVSENPAHAQRTLRLARGMEGLAWTGVALMASGAAIAIIGATRLRRARRSEHANWIVAPGPTSVSFRLRF